MLIAGRDDLILALVAIFSVTEVFGPTGRCAEALDAAIEGACEEDETTLRAVGVAKPTSARFGAARVLNTLCGACGACPRGRGEPEAGFMVAVPRRAA